jgi:uncharacterized membrane protein
MVFTIQDKKEMNMDRILKKIVWLVMIIPAVYLAITWNRLPEKVAMHYDLRGQVDRYGSKNELITMVIVLIAVNVLVYLLLTNIYRIDPKKYAAENKSRLNRMAFAVSVFLSALLCMLLYSSLQNNIKFSMRIILAGIGLLFAIMGNYMHNIKPNYFAGFRLPWALENEENWKKTHAYAGKLWFFGGILAAVVCLLMPDGLAAIIAFFTITFIMTLIPIVYSYRLFREQKRSGSV